MVEDQARGHDEEVVVERLPASVATVCASGSTGDAFGDQRDAAGQPVGGLAETA
jgi:hypothetical protein